LGLTLPTIRRATSAQQPSNQCNGKKQNQTVSVSTKADNNETKGGPSRGEALVDIARSYNVSHSTISRLGAVFTA
jgi:hypothetical protein